MTLKLELPPDIEARYQAEAKAKGVPVDEFIKVYLIQHAPTAEPLPMSVEDWEKAFDEWADSFPDTPPIPDEALRRELIYHRD